MPCTTKSGRKGRSWLRRASSANWRRSSRENDRERYAGVVFEVQKGEARSTGEAGTLLQVYVNDYRMVGIGSRILFGVMTGNAFIDAKASYTDLNDGFGRSIENLCTAHRQRLVP